MTGLSGTTAVVTGASRGIGAATAAALRNAGARVAGLARTLTPVRESSRLDISCDLTDGKAIAKAASEIIENWGPPEVLVNNAGAFLLSSFEDTDEEALNSQLAVNLRAPFAVARAFLPAMREAGRGIMVTVGSVADHLAMPGNAAYAASKFGLRGLHQVLAEEYRHSGVRFSLISPGPTDTDAWNPVDPDNREGFMNRTEMLRPEDVAEAILFTVSRRHNVEIDLLRIRSAPGAGKA